MRLLLRTLLLLLLLTRLHAAKRAQSVSVKSGRGEGPPGWSKTVKLLLDPSVLPHMVLSSDSSIANTSLSPWTYRVSYDESRVPRRIAHAQCLTLGCLGLDGGEVLDLVAAPIHYQVLVLRRVQRGRRNGPRQRGRSSYTLGTEMVSVGCTCVKPSVLHEV